jgi:hypothetical protein
MNFMKLLLYIGAICGIAALPVACKKSEIKTYDGEVSIYFPRSVTSPYLDTLAVTFTFAPPSVTDSVILVPVRIAGAPESVNRAYELAVSSESSAVEGADYEFLSTKPFEIKAGKVADTVRIKLNRKPELMDQQKSLILSLKPNENFKTDILYRIKNAITGEKVSHVDYKIYFNDILRKPGRWLDTYLGTFTRKKAFLMIELLNIDLAYLDNAAAIPEIVYYGKFLQRYLNEKAGMGETIYEEDGTPMVMGPSVQ